MQAILIRSSLIFNNLRSSFNSEFRFSAALKSDCILLKCLLFFSLHFLAASRFFARFCSIKSLSLI